MIGPPSFGQLWERWTYRFVGCLAALDIPEQAAGARVEPPGDGDAGEIEEQEGPWRGWGPAGQTDRGAVALRDEERAVGSDGRREADDGRPFLLGLTDASCAIGSRHQPIHLLAHDGGNHLEGRGVAD